MIIYDLDHIEVVDEISHIDGGGNIWQSLIINQVANAVIGNSGGNSIGNTAIAINIAIPIVIGISLPQYQCGYLGFASRFRRR